MAMSADTDVAIIGAGPYGLSIAAHLRMAGVEHRIFGSPMHLWRRQMPKGMFLKSEGFASDLYDPEGSFTLRRFCAENAIAYADMGMPVHLDTFIAYGLAFQQRLAPHLEDKTLVALSRSANGFRLRLDDGETFTARRVVLAIGIDHFRRIPGQLAHLPCERLTHSADHHDLARFKDRDVAVIGGGSSAIDLAGLLHESGARVCLVPRRRTLDIHSKMQLPRSLWQRIVNPMSGIGPSWRHRFYTDAPLLFHYLPEASRVRKVRNHLGPAAGWFMKDRVLGRVPILLGHEPRSAELSSDGVVLKLVAADGTERRLATEHIIAATGFEIDLHRLSFLSADIVARLKMADRTPVLSSRFQSSLPGLYFVGPATANSFGPVMRFAFGAGFTARRIAQHLAASMTAPAPRRRPVEPADLLVRTPG
jgi:thioredoxin reductase